MGPTLLRLSDGVSPPLNGKHTLYRLRESSTSLHCFNTLAVVFALLRGEHQLYVRFDSAFYDIKCVAHATVDDSPCDSNSHLPPNAWSAGLV